MFLQRFIRLNANLLEELLRHLADKLHQLIPGQPKTGIVFFKSEGKVTMASIEVKDDAAPLNASVKFFDAEGNETPPDELPAWASSDESVATVTASEDGLSAEVAIGAPGVALISVSTVETNTGASIEAQGTITVTAGDTTMGEVSFEEAPPA